MKMEIIKRVQYDYGGLEIGFCYGIKVIPTDETQEVFYPAYPYAQSEEVLEKFVGIFKEELEAFFASGDRSYFSFHLHGFNTELKERLKDRWHKQGVMID
ncbi:hypothetical protein [Streptococcus acidominimus]|uniref:Uncharacterized protein n=1 Tax=Streptococcus acidominimus TaxID=1326 RepID=A0A4Y9FUE1_STRAI|nr:hypothetical protein [Streptococcus acidominimus]MBF0817860.1 hypothetical protein [Streptococcus acidominimus]MBF0838376.1 hypothetical protein [Streptococcus acidominimus]MBF0846261.1 hypothetical protein [Streptococcus danieliae]TFU31849.1 hypothetical protein E4U01_00055 [Streptococcus acidominimus]